MGPDEGWQCNSISAQKKGAAVSVISCAFCLWSLSACAVFIMFLFIYGNSLGVFACDTMFT